MILSDNKNRSLKTKNNLFSLTLPFLIGLEDSVNPASLALIIFFILFLFYFAKTQKKILWLGFVFLGSAFWSSSLVVQGNYDSLLSYPSVVAAIPIILISLGVLILCIGVVHLRDWWCYTKLNDPEKFWYKLPQIFQIDRGINKKRNFFINGIRFIVSTLFTAILAFVLVLLASVETQDYEIFMFLLDSSMTGNGDKVKKALYLYSFSYILPMFLFWLISYFVARSKTFQDQVLKHLSKVKIICAAVFMAVGVGLIFMYTYSMYFDKFLN